MCGIRGFGSEDKAERRSGGRPARVLHDPDKAGDREDELLGVLQREHLLVEVDYRQYATQIMNFVGIAQNKCVNKENYFLCINIDEKSRLLNIGKKKKYTIIEGIKLYEMLNQHKNLQINNSQFWLKAQQQGILPERTADSMKNFWKKNFEYKTLEEYLIECLHEGTDFCLSFKQIPNQQFVDRFKQQYAQEFVKLTTLEQLDNEEAHAVKNLGRQIVGA